MRLSYAVAIVPEADGKGYYAVVPSLPGRRRSRCTSGVSVARDARCRRKGVDDGCLSNGRVGG